MLIHHHTHCFGLDVMRCDVMKYKWSQISHIHFFCVLFSTLPEFVWQIHATIQTHHRIIASSQILIDYIFVQWTLKLHDSKLFDFFLVTLNQVCLFFCSNEMINFHLKFNDLKFHWNWLIFFPLSHTYTHTQSVNKNYNNKKRDSMILTDFDYSWNFCEKFVRFLLKCSFCEIGHFDQLSCFQCPI